MYVTLMVALLAESGFSAADATPDSGFSGFFGLSRAILLGK